MTSGFFRSPFQENRYQNPAQIWMANSVAHEQIATRRLSTTPSGFFVWKRLLYEGFASHRKIRGRGEVDGVFQII